MKKVSVVILNWNGKDMLRRFLPSVVEYSCGDGVEVCVADNSSTDDSVEYVRVEFPNVRLIELDCNYGFAEGYNRALQQVDAEYVVLLNSDVEVTPGWLSPLLAYMNEHPEAAACQPKLCGFYNKSLFEYAGAAGGYLDVYGYPFCRGRIFDTLELDEGQYDSVKSVFWVSGAAMFVRLKDYWEAGGLDGLFFAHMEEIDLCWRLKSKGKELVCVPQSKVFHVGGGTLNKENSWKTYLNFRNSLLMLYKNLTDRDLRRVLNVRFWLDRLAALVFLLKGESENAKAVLRAWRDFKAMRTSYKSCRDSLKRLSCCDPKRTSYSILWKYYICRKKCFSQLQN